MISLIRKNGDFKCNTLMNWKPMKVHQSFSDMIKFWNSAKYTCGKVGDNDTVPAQDILRK